jgi:hypothetical protein
MFLQEFDYSDVDPAIFEKIRKKEEEKKEWDKEEAEFQELGSTRVK